ncbi:unnamed protein product [Peronospora destructor]|uniref:Uncharacterized protein n=1 Tax=Peronospora destructor TaxID=86335 RepID=A0AAV0VFR6_9STRA|nr:unnamed protein product [Peronospora destructor]
MLDHLLPLIYREFEYFDEANKENFGYCIRRRARPVFSQVSTPSRTPPRPPRRTNSSLNVDGGLVSSHRLKRRRETLDDSNEEQRDAKKQHIRGIPKDDEAIAKKKQVKQETLTVKQKFKEKQRHMEPVTPIKKMQESKMSALKAAKKIKMSKKNKQTKVTEHSKQKETIQVVKNTTPKRMPLQDITHLYVNEHTRSYAYQQRERFVAGLSTSVAIRFL